MTGATISVTHVLSVVASGSVMLECSCGWSEEFGPDPYLWDLTDAASRHEADANGSPGVSS